MHGFKEFSRNQYFIQSVNNFYTLVDYVVKYFLHAEKINKCNVFAVRCTRYNRIGCFCIVLPPVSSSKTFASAIMLSNVK